MDTTNAEGRNVGLSALLGALPDGWLAETQSYWPDCMMISPGGGMWVTCDFYRRLFGIGYAPPSTHPVLHGRKGFAGRGWKEQMVKAAVQYMQQRGLTPNAQVNARAGFMARRVEPLVSTEDSNGTP